MKESELIKQQWELLYTGETPLVIREIEKERRSKWNSFDVLCEINPELPDKDELQLLLRAVPRLVFALMEARRVCKRELDLTEEPNQADEHEYALGKIEGALEVAGLQS